MAAAREPRFVPDWRVAALTAGVCIIACLAFALAPAVHATRRTIPLGSLDRGGTRRARFHLRAGFLAIQIAVCTVLLFGAALVTRAIAHATAFDPGFRVEEVHLASVSLPHEASTGERTAFGRQLFAALERGAGAPIAAGHPAPFTDFPFTIGIALPHEAPRDHRQVARRSVSHRYFEVLGIPLVRGRMFASDATGEVVVNEAFARAYWRGADPLGQMIRHIDSKGAIAGTLAIVGRTGRIPHRAEKDRAGGLQAHDVRDPNHQRRRRHARADPRDGYRAEPGRHGQGVAADRRSARVPQ